MPHKSCAPGSAGGAGGCCAGGAGNDCWPGVDMQSSCVTARAREMLALALSFKDMSDNCHTSAVALFWNVCSWGAGSATCQVQGRHHVQILLLRLLISGCLAFNQALTRMISHCNQAAIPPRPSR